MNRKGFSFIELIVVIATLGILASLLIPALHRSSQASKEKVDKAAILNLETLIQTAAQHNSIYKDAKQIADQSADGQLVIVYSVNEDDLVTFEYCEIINKENAVIRNTVNNEQGLKLDKLRNKITAYTNSNMEQIECQSGLYKTQKYKFILTFPDVEFKVNIDTEFLPAG